MNHLPKTHEQRCAAIVALLQYPVATRSELEYQKLYRAVCVECGAEFESGHRSAKVCSHGCRVRRNNRAAAKRMRARHRSLRDCEGRC